MIPDMEWAAMLKRATALKREGRLDDAIAVLRQVFASGQSVLTFGPAACSKLPKYLALAGRFDEAEQEYQRMLKCARAADGDICFTISSRIYSDMSRLSRQIGQQEKAAAFDLVASLLWNLGLRIQKRTKEEPRWTKRDMADLAVDVAGGPNERAARLTEHIAETYRQGIAFDLDAFLEKAEEILRR